MPRKSNRVADVLPFVPQDEADANENMARFVDLCRTRLTVFGQSLPFDKDVWDVSDTVHLKGKHHAVHIVFSNFETAKRKRGRVMMSEPFKAFAKSYIRYQHAMRPTKNISQRLAALRSLEAALKEMGTLDPIHITAQILNRAAQLQKERFGSDTAYRTAVQLELIARFLLDHRLLIVPTRWRNPLPRPIDTERIGREADERRAAKMPSEAALESLPKIFRLAAGTGDVLVSAVTAILCAAPDRIAEVFELPVDCEVRQSVKESGANAYGLRWWPAKGAEPTVKWIIPSMTSVVEEAIEKIRKVTNEARQIARWYELHPRQLYLPEDLEHLRAAEWLSMVDVGKIVFADPVSKDTVNTWRGENELPEQRRGRKVYVRFADVEKVVIGMLPRAFPIAHPTNGMKYSETLLVMQRNALHESRATMRSTIKAVSHLQISDGLGGRSKHGVESLFERYGFHEPDGSSIRVTSHQFRHYLDTLAQIGGLSQLDIAKWSGRKDVRQNRAYDHETPQAIVERIRSVVREDTRLSGPVATQARAALIPRDEFARLKVVTAHTTDFGYCIHDYVMSPCQLHRDCLNCGEQVCVKGEVAKETRVRRAHAEAQRLLVQAEQAEREGEFGAHEWVEHHRHLLDRLNGLVDILDDPKIPRGSVIQLRPADTPSRLAHAAQARALLLGLEDDLSLPRLQAPSGEAT
ncbi:integrase [Ralstonia sp. Ralssp110]|uniref:integrase n=1 Tax=Ralstonia sp. Ralssp110 TaxID=3243004 RepID=UPI0039B463DD